jgi:Fe-S-cluster containining protein
MIDVAREPRIAAVARPFKLPGPQHWEREWVKQERELAKQELTKHELTKEERELAKQKLEEYEEELEEYERVGPLVPGWEYGGSLNTGPDRRACPFLGGVPGEKERLCGIYPTRPNCCVAMQAGGNQCQESRRMVGLEPLQPIASIPAKGAMTECL